MSWSAAESLHRAIKDERREPKSAAHLARTIEDRMFAMCAQGGVVLGSQSMLAAHFGVGRAVVREAIRILEARGSIRTSRGPHGGVIVATPDERATVRNAVQYFQLVGVDRHRIAEADAELRAILSGAQGDRFASHCAFKLYAQIVATMLEAAPDTAAAARSRTRAERLAYELAERIRREHLATGERLGAEDALCDTYGVSRLVLRQAIRILESVGLVSSERGRGRGVVVSTPGPFALINLTHVYFAAHRLNADDTKTLLRRLNVVNARLAALHVDASGRIEIARLRDKLAARRHADPLVWLEAPQLISKIAGNVCIDAFARCLVAYLARAHPEKSVMSAGLSAEVAELFSSVLAAVATGDPSVAERAQFEMQDAVRALFARKDAARA
jgi:DNA-binding FadR family transcriptional regulator